MEEWHKDAFTFYSSSIKRQTSMSKSLAYSYLHSTLVLLKAISQVINYINLKGFTFYSSSIKSFCYSRKLFFQLYLHSTLVLLKADIDFSKLTPNLDLHSTLVLLKDQKKIVIQGIIQHLHSTLVLLKVNNLTGTEIFTLYSSSIKRISPKLYGIKISFIYILLQFY